jgi:hypothetical protein
LGGRVVENSKETRHVGIEGKWGETISACLGAGTNHKVWENFFYFTGDVITTTKVE